MTRALAIAVLLVALAAPALRGAAAPEPSAADALGEARAAQARAAREYRGSLERVASLQQEAVERAARTVETRRAQVAAGLIARAEVQPSEQELAAAEAALARTREEMRAAEALVAEAEAVIELAALPPAPVGEPHVTSTLVRFHGPSAWTLGAAPALERFFASRFGRPLPVSAFGQTPLHDRLGFDHHNALDVAVHPESAEGAALIAWLHGRGISFIAFRGAVPGASTGAHVHVGEPSPRVAGSHPG
ncbi:MAG TPA: hypothetical protein VGU22_14480 [Methylomirabilota bacterium]|nr:hypothetical protein [Methylomirabilota bacterium]